MNRTNRYTRTGAPRSDGVAQVTLALDPVTGLPVRVYRFDADATASAGALSHPNLLAPLESGRDDDGAYLVSNHVDGAVDLARQPAGLGDTTALAAFEALAFAHACGVVHGDLVPRRVWRRGRDVWLEGFGVPWRPGSSPVDDVRQLASGLLELPGSGLSVGCIDVLTTAASDANADAESVAAALEALAAAPAPTAAPTLARPTPVVAAAAPTATPEVVTPPPAAVTPAANAAEPGAAQERAPTAAAAAAAEPTPAATAPSRFSKTPPPDVTYRAGDSLLDERRDSGTAPHHPRHDREQRRRLWLLAALLVGALVLAILTAVARRPLPPPAAEFGPVTSIVVDVRIEPASLPPATLVIVSSPSGSRLAPGSALGTVPRRVVFDAEGVWQIEARFQERRSESVTFRLPEERDIVLRFAATP